MVNETWRFLYSLRNNGSSFGIDRMRKLVDLIGNPEKSFLVIHVAGTNGKGSVCSMLDSIYRENKYKTGLFTSPHLIELGERVRVNGKMISNAEIESWVTWLRPKAKKVEEDYKMGHPTFFEFMTAIAFLHFKKQNVEIAIFETGLGGRLDSTNVVSPILSIITTISKDHCNILGNSFEEIASEKAGIIKENIPVLFGWLPTSAENVIVETAKKMGSVIFSPKQISENRLPSTNLVGNYQRKNAFLALQATKIVQNQITVRPESTLRGLNNVNLLGRWQMIEKPCKIILDACHNEAGALCLQENLENLNRRLEVWVGVLGEDRAVPIMQVVSRFASSIKLFEVDQPRACSISFLKSQVPNSFSGEVIEFNVDEVKNFLSNVDAEKTILITGSIYLIGQILGVIKSQNVLNWNDLF